MTKLFIGVLVCVLFPMALIAQSLQVNAGEITDYRSSGSFSGKLEMNIVVVGAGLKNCRGIRKPILLKAIDDSGKSLLVTKKADQESNPVYDFRKLDGEQIETEIELKGPARKAKTIQEISGTLEVHYPDTKSKSIVKGFMNQTGKPLNVPAFKKSKTQISVLTKAQFEELKAKEEAEASKNASLEDAMSGVFSSMFSSMGESDLLLLINDPTKQIVDLEFLNAAGESIEIYGRSLHGNKIVYSFESLPPADAQLVIFTASASSLKKIPFTLKNVTLP